MSGLCGGFSVRFSLWGFLCWVFSVGFSLWGWGGARLGFREAALDIADDDSREQVAALELSEPLVELEVVAACTQVKNQFMRGRCVYGAVREPLIELEVVAACTQESVHEGPVRLRGCASAEPLPRQSPSQGRASPTAEPLVWQSLSQGRPMAEPLLRQRLSSAKQGRSTCLLWLPEESRRLTPTRALFGRGTGSPGVHAIAPRSIPTRRRAIPSAALVAL